MKSSRPLVSVVTTAYNQEAYIKDALNGFVAQKTNFPFEVIVSDDHSSDKTAAIIKEYAKKYPDIIKPYLRPKNVGSMTNYVEAFKMAKGKYVAVCEGDDFWTDPQKLQLQVDFMEAHPDYAMCFHPVRMFFENHEKEDSVFPEAKTGFTLRLLLQSNFIQTNSVMYRRRPNYNDLSVDVMPGDWYVHLYHARFGKIGFINKVMSAYRRHSEGLWWESFNSPDKFWIQKGMGHLLFGNEMLKMYGRNKAYSQSIKNYIFEMGTRSIEVDEKKNTSIIRDTALKAPEVISIFTVLQYDKIIEDRRQHLIDADEINKLSKSIDVKDIEISKLETTKLELENTVSDIQNSLSWRITKILRTTSGLFRKNKYEK